MRWSNLYTLKETFLFGGLNSILELYWYYDYIVFIIFIHLPTVLRSPIAK